jgi:hypothetical protein
MFVYNASYLSAIILPNGGDSFERIDDDDMQCRLAMSTVQAIGFSVIGHATSRRRLASFST